MLVGYHAQRNLAMAPNYVVTASNTIPPLRTEHHQETQLKQNGASDAQPEGYAQAWRGCGLSFAQSHSSLRDLQALLRRDPHRGHFNRATASTRSFLRLMKPPQPTCGQSNCERLLGDLSEFFRERPVTAAGLFA